MFQSGLVSIIHRPLDGLLDIIAMGIPEFFTPAWALPLFLRSDTGDFLII